MSNINPVSKITAVRSVPGGALYFNRRSSDGTYDGERYIGLTPGFQWTVKGTELDSWSSERGAQELDRSIVVRVERTGQITCRQIDENTLSMFLIAASSLLTQASTPVTDELITVKPNRYYQLGLSTNNRTGVRGISAVSISRTHGEDASTWVADTVTALNSYIRPVVANTYFYKCTVRSGDFKTHATTEPIWPTTVGATVTDDVITWTCMGLIVASQTTDIVVDTDLARLYVEPTGSIETVGEPIEVDYTPAANDRRNIAASALAKVEGALRFVAAPIDGPAIDLFAPNVSLTPNGDAVQKEADPKFMELSWNVKFSVGMNGEAAIYLDSRPDADF